MYILIFFLGHWFSSLFFQSFFLHRYAAHGMFKLSKFWERLFYLLTFITQGSSFLNPAAYANMHRRHHAFSDTESDPHSPHFSKNIISMMTKTFRIYHNILDGKAEENEFGKNVPEWNSFDNIVSSWWIRIVFGLLYTLYYVAFSTSPWHYFLLPVHFFMGPIHGSIVNWCGHKYGYVNHRDTNDKSRNTLPIDLPLLGELFQNNHHKYPERPNFACHWYELDPTYHLLKLLSLFKIISFNPPK